MKKLIALLTLWLGLALATGAFAQGKPAEEGDKAPTVTTTTTVTEGVKVESKAGTVTEVVKVEEKTEAAAAPVPNKGDTGFMYVATVLVTLMTVPGLALFYGGLVRQKNMLSVLMQVFVVLSLIAVLWALYGYSIAFTAGNPFFGGFDKVFLRGITPDSVAATFSKGVVIPELSFVVFQLTFAAITPALIIGAFAERMKFSAVLVFMVIWFTFSYLPIAHMVWYWDGPDAITDAKSLETVTANAGWLWAKGALDFAGGTVVHINAGVAGLVGAYLIGKRIGLGKEAFTPHSLTLTMVGASLLWVGWFGFNAGSNLEANGTAMLAFANTMLATAAAVLSWTFLEWIFKGKPSMLGAASGAVAGLVAVTPACGFIGLMGSIVLGLLAGTRRVRCARRGRHPRCAVDRCALRAVARRDRRLRLRDQRGQSRVLHLGTGRDAGNRGRDHDHLVGDRLAHRLQDHRHGGGPARERGRGARGPGHHPARGVGLPRLDDE